MVNINGSVGRGGRNSYADTKAVQNLLNRHRAVVAPQKALVPDGDIGPLTISAILRFQNLVVGLSSPDGRVDPGGTTLRHLNAGTVVAGQDGLAGPGSTIAEAETPAEETAAQGPAQFDYRAGPQEKLADIAAYYVGAREAAGNRHGNDPRMMEIFACDEGVNPGDGYAWCCALVTLCTQKLIAQKPVDFGHLTDPATAYCPHFRDTWAVQSKCRITSPNDFNAQPHKGDVIVFDFSHIGIIESTNASGIVSIEGNTNADGGREGHSCLRKTRSWGSIARQKIIRYPVAVQPEEDLGPIYVNPANAPAPFDWLPHYNSSTPNGHI